MKKNSLRKRLAMAFSVLGVVLMGADLLITRNFFSHVGELMVASLLCFVVGIALDRSEESDKPRAGHNG